MNHLLQVDNCELRAQWKNPASGLKKIGLEIQDESYECNFRPNMSSLEGTKQHLIIQKLLTGRNLSINTLVDKYSQ